VFDPFQEENKMIRALLVASAMGHTIAGTVVDLSVAFPMLSSTNKPSAAAVLTTLAAEASTDAVIGDAEDVIDVYGNSNWLSGFEREVAQTLGKERAVFVQTGVAAQNMALCVHAGLPFLAQRTQPKPCFIMHPTSHLNLYEERAFDTLLGLVPLLAGDESKPLVADDIE
jgi:threonine aldolase